MNILTKAQKVKKSNIISKTVACLTLVLACNSSLAEIVPGEDPSMIYICGYAPLSQKGTYARQSALKRAEMAALQEFVAYALKENLILPESLTRLSLQIKNELMVSSSYGQIIGAEPIRSLILKDNRAACFVKIPKENLQRFKNLDLRNNPEAIMAYLPGAKLLKLEIALELASQGDYNLISPTSPLGRSMQGATVVGVHPLWFRLKTLDQAAVSAMTERDLLLTLEGSLVLPDLQKMLTDELHRRGYIKTAQYLTGHTIARKKELAACLEFLKTAKLAQEPEFLFTQILANHACCIDFANTQTQNTPFEQAQMKFASLEPDFKEIRQLIFDSFMIAVSDNAMNMLGRCYEEEGMYAEALVCYFQTYSMNPNQEYVKLNLANSFYALGDKENALFWANETLGDSSSSAWSKEMAQQLVDKMQEAPVKSPS